MTRAYLPIFISILLVCACKKEKVVVEETPSIPPVTERRITDEKIVYYDTVYNVVKMCRMISYYYSPEGRMTMRKISDSVTNVPFRDTLINTYRYDSQGRISYITGSPKFPGSYNTQFVYDNSGKLQYLINDGLSRIDTTMITYLNNIMVRTRAGFENSYFSTDLDSMLTFNGNTIESRDIYKYNAMEDLGYRALRRSVPIHYNSKELIEVQYVNGKASFTRSYDQMGYPEYMLVQSPWQKYRYHFFYSH